MDAAGSLQKLHLYICPTKVPPSAPGEPPACHPWPPAAGLWCLGEPPAWAVIWVICASLTVLLMNGHLGGRQLCSRVSMADVSHVCNHPDVSHVRNHPDASHVRNHSDVSHVCNQELDSGIHINISLDFIGCFV